MAPKVRYFEHSDAGEVLQLYQSVGSWFEDVGVDKEFIVQSSQRPDFRYLVCADDGKIVGFIGALYFEAVGRAEIGPVGVAESRRGSGIGGMLAEEMLSFLFEKGIRRVYARVKANNSKAVNFFLKHGFSYEAYLRSYTLKFGDVVQLVRQA